MNQNNRQVALPYCSEFEHRNSFEYSLLKFNFRIVSLKSIRRVITEPPPRIEDIKNEIIAASNDNKFSFEISLSFANATKKPSPPTESPK